FSDEMVELLLFALEDLRQLLQQQGSNLMIKFGVAENVIIELAKEVNPTHVFIEQEVEHELCMMLENVNKSLSSCLLGLTPEVITWKTPFYDNLVDILPWSFEDFQKMKLPIASPVVELPRLPASGVDFPWGDLPSLAELKQYTSNDVVQEEWSSITRLSAMDQLRKKRRPISESRELLEDEQPRKKEKRRKPQESAFITSQEKSVGGGATRVLNAFAAYLRYLEGTARDEWQEVHEKLRVTEKRQGASFDALFRPALLLGIISKRQVYFEAIKYERERNGGFLSPFGYSTTTVAAAIDSVSSMEWYWLLALKSLRYKNKSSSIRIYQWKNYIVQYTVADRHKGPNFLLVHGFGAFLEHYRDNIHPLAEGGNNVWAITLLGYGKSEKPNMVYTELVWAELLRDFIVEVIQEPVHLVGNSIGGYVVAIVACLWPTLAKSVVLVNSSGNAVPEYNPAFSESKDRRISAEAWFGARFLQTYFRFNIKNTVKSFYPKRSDRADDWLVNEMTRSLNDPGAIFILESIFSLDLSIPLNYLVKNIEKTVLIIQGMRDPLLDSQAKLTMLKEHCKGITVKEIDAGHCPHDELPSDVNLMIMEWVESLE
ncbi:hypothetical protein M569_00444, partial [Genlisea aurea]